MRVLIKEKLSPNKYKTPEGYLVCVDAILARTGKQQYRRNELYVDSDDDSIVDVDRPYDEVFSEQTIASFENKPFVNEHPNEDVNVHNHKDYAVGFVRDVHKGEVDGEPVLLGNLIITDEETIAEIESGEKTELSCGYDCDITDDENPCQRNIRGNHVALCKAGRAGIARIQDSQVEDSIKDSAEDDFYDELFSSNLKYEFIKGGYGIKFKSPKDYQKAKEIAKRTYYSKGKWYDKDLEFFEYGGTTISNEDSVADSIQDSDFKYLSEEAKKLKEELGLYKKQIGIHTTTNKKEYSPRQNQYNNKLVKELNESINEAIDNLSKGIYTPSAWHRLSQHLETWSGEPELEKICNKANSAIKKFIKYLETKSKDSMEEMVKDKLENKPIKVRIKFESNQEANDALKMLCKKEQFTDCDLIFGDTVEVKTTDVYVDDLKKALRLYFVKKIEVKDSEELVEDGRLIEPEQKYVKEFERMIQRVGFKIDKTGKTISGRLHYQVITNQKGYDEKDLKRFSKELEKIANTMRSFEIPMTYNVGLQVDTYISAGIDLDKQWVEDSIEDTNCQDEAIYMYIADPDDDKDIIYEAKHYGLKLEKFGGLIKVIGTLTQIAKTLKMLPEDVIAYSKKSMSTIKKVKDVDSHKEATQELEKETKKLDSIKVLKLINITKKAKLVKDRKSPWDVKVGDIITHARLMNGKYKYKVLKVEYEFPGRPEYVWVRLLETPDLKYSDDPYAFRPVDAMVSGDLTIIDSVKDSKVKDAKVKDLDPRILPAIEKLILEAIDLDKQRDKVIIQMKKTPDVFGVNENGKFINKNKFVNNGMVKAIIKKYQDILTRWNRIMETNNFLKNEIFRPRSIEEGLDAWYLQGLPTQNALRVLNNLKKDYGIKDSCKDSVYKIKTFNNKWYYEETREDGYSDLVGPFKTSAEARAALQKHRPNVKVRHLESGTYYDAMELSAKTSEELDNLMKQYQKKHPTWTFGEIRKDKGIYKCSVVKDSDVIGIKKTDVRNLSQKQLLVVKENCLKYIKEGKPGLVETIKEILDKVEKELKRRGL